MIVPKDIQNRFATRIRTRSIGGIVLCGINWGDGEGSAGDVIKTATDSNWTEYFSETGNRYPYQRRIINWFDSWGFKLSPDNPTEMDNALLQTNLFLDQSKHDHPRTDDDWELAVNNLIESINFLMPSAILFLSIPMFKEAARKAKKFNSKKWGEAMGILTFDNPTIRFNDPTQAKKYFEILFPSGGNKIPLAAIPHPTAPFFNRYKSDAAAAEAKPIMGPWLENALNNYKRIQINSNSSGQKSDPTNSAKSRTR